MAEPSGLKSHTHNEILQSTFDYLRLIPPCLVKYGLDGTTINRRINVAIRSSGTIWICGELNYVLVAIRDYVWLMFMRKGSSPKLITLFHTWMAFHLWYLTPFFGRWPKLECYTRPSFISVSLFVIVFKHQYSFLYIGFQLYFHANYSLGMSTSGDRYLCSMYRQG